MHYLLVIANIYHVNKILINVKIKSNFVFPVFNFNFVPKIIQKYGHVEIKIKNSTQNVLVSFS